MLLPFREVCLAAARSYLRAKPSNLTSPKVGCRVCVPGRSPSIWSSPQQPITMSRPLLLSFTRVKTTALSAGRLRPSAFPPIAVRARQRDASSSDKPKIPKNISLEQPDKFRPPSHPSRLVKGRSRGSTFNGAYNQSSTEAERDAQRDRRYPHTFPNQGTFAHRVLTNRRGHIGVALVSS